MDLDTDEQIDQNSMTTTYFSQFLPLAFDQELDSYTRRSQQLVIKAKLDEMVEQVAHIEFETSKQMPESHIFEADEHSSQPDSKMTSYANGDDKEEKSFQQGDRDEASSKPAEMDDCALQAGNNKYSSQPTASPSTTANMTTETTKAPLQLDNIVLTLDPKNFIRLTEIGPREQNFLLSIISAKSLLVLLDKQIVPLYASLEDDESVCEVEKILFQSQVDAGSKRYYRLILSVTYKSVVLSVTEIYYSSNLGKDLVTKINIPGMFIISFREKLSKRIAELEPYIKKLQANKVDIEDFVDFEHVNCFQKIGILVSRKDDRDNSIFMSLPVIYRTIYYLQYYDEMHATYCSTSSTAPAFPVHFIEEDNRRYDYILEFLNKKFVLSIKQTTEGQQSKQILKIDGDHINLFCLRLEDFLKKLEGCRGCSKAGHHWKSCPKENHSISSSSTVTLSKGSSSGHSPPKYLYKQDTSQPYQADSHVLDQVEYSQRTKKPSESCSFASCLSFNSSEHSKDEADAGKKNVQDVTKLLSDTNQGRYQTSAGATKNREVSVLAVKVQGEYVIKVIEEGTKCSEFLMTLKTAEEFIALLNTKLIPMYNKIDNKTAVSKHTTTHSRFSLQSAYKNTTFLIEFGLNRYAYFLRIAARFTWRSRNGDVPHGAERTVVMVAERMSQFSAKLKAGIAEAEALKSPSNSIVVDQNAFTSEPSKNNGYLEPSGERWTSINPSTSRTVETIDLQNDPVIIPVDQLRWFDREESNIHYIGIGKNTTEELYLSLPVAAKCDECLYELEKKVTLSRNFQSGSLVNSAPLKHQIKEKCSRYDLELVLNSCEKVLSFCETYTGTGKPSVSSFCINANQIWLLRIELKKRVAKLRSKVCEQCGKAKHQGRDCISSILDCSLFNQDEPNNCFSTISPIVVNGNRESKGTERVRQTFEVPKNLICDVSKSEAVELSVIRRQNLGTKEYVQIAQSNGPGEVTSFQMSVREVGQLVDRLENKILKSFRYLSIEDTDGLANPLYDQWLEKTSDKQSYKLEYGFDKKQFFFKITQFFYLDKLNKEEKRVITIPADCLQSFCDLLAEKQDAARNRMTSDSECITFGGVSASSSLKMRRVMDDYRERENVEDNRHQVQKFSSIAPVKSRSRETFDKDKDVCTMWENDCCYIKVTNIQASKSYLWLGMQDVHKFVFMLKQFDAEYQNLDDKNAKCEKNKHLKYRDLEGVDSSFHMRFGVNHIGYYLRIEQSYPSKMGRTVVVSGYAIHCFIDLLNRTLIDSGACFKCGVKGHFAANCRPSAKACFGCGSLTHRKANCPAPEGTKFTPI